MVAKARIEEDVFLASEPGDAGCREVVVALPEGAGLIDPA
jgi:hypothetical protein